MWSSATGPGAAGFSPPQWLQCRSPLRQLASPLAPPSEPQAAAGRGAHEGTGPAAAPAASPLYRSAADQCGHGRGMNVGSPRELEWKAAALQPEAGAMPEKRAGAQAAGGSWVSTGGSEVPAWEAGFGGVPERAGLRLGMTGPFRVSHIPRWPNG